MATKKKATSKLLAGINRKFGEGYARYAAGLGFPERLPFGVLHLDYLTGGGLVLGKGNLFHGSESGTKTSTAIIAARNYLNRYADREALYIDAENKFPLAFSRAIGVPDERLILAYPTTGEETVDVIEHAIRQSEIGIIVIDSLAALAAKVEVEASANDQQQGIAARLVNKLIRKLAAAQNAWTQTRGWAPTVILINQERHNIGVKFGDPTVIPGGKGQQFYVSLRLRFRAVSAAANDAIKIPKGSPIIKVAARVVKNSFSAKGGTTEYLLAMRHFKEWSAGTAVDEILLQELAIRRGILEKNGSGFLFEGASLGSEEKVTKALAERGDLYRAIKAELMLLIDEDGR